MFYPSLSTDLKIFAPSTLLCLDDFLLSKDMLMYCLISLHNEQIGNPFLNPLATPIQVQRHVLKLFPKTRITFCELDPLRDFALQYIWRMKKCGVDLEAYQFNDWCHGILSFDLKVGGIPQSHKSNELAVKFFKDIFNAFEHRPNKSMRDIRGKEDRLQEAKFGPLKSLSVLKQKSKNKLSIDA